ncbi:MAG: DNRLRE domain-containing protein [Oscillospiraceae bacterium]|jgi:hypothetical protein
MRLKVLISFLVLTAMLFSMTAAFAAPAPPPDVAPVVLMAAVEATSSAYVSEAHPTTNINDQALGVGTDASGKLRVSLIRFYPIMEADGGPLPDGAEITGASIRLYKSNLREGTVTVCKLSGSFDEETVTWQTKPAYKTVGGALMDIGSADIADDPGWYSIPVPADVVETWAGSSADNRGVAVVPEWDDASNTIYFRSDDHADCPPTLMISYTVPQSDTIPCALTYTVSPENPTEGELVTITVRATDNKALSYAAIMRGPAILARQEAEGTEQRTLTVSYTEVASAPSMSYTIVADDIDSPPPVSRDVTVAVAESMPDAYDPSTASGWAVSEIERAIESGLTVDEILSNFQKDITRREFCQISVKLYEKMTGRTASPAAPNPFTDTSDPEILKAYNLGITKGVAPDRFAPDLPITRQEICVMLTRALKAAIPTLNTSVTDPTVFADEKEIADWAIIAVRYMNSRGIMRGVGSNTINPLGNTTREQAIALVLRTYEAFL